MTNTTPIQRFVPRPALLLASTVLIACLAGSARGQFELAADLAPGTVQDSLFQLTSASERSITVGGLTFFRGCTAVNGCEPWITDGTALGTQLLADAAAGPTSGLSTSAGFHLYDGLVYFVVGDGATDQLWRSDATPGGTQAFLERVGGSALEVIGSELWFSGWDATHGAEPWTTDGSVSGSQMLADLAPGSDSSAPSQFTEVGSQVFFAAESSALGRELYVSDGTGPGTAQVADINASTGDSSPLDLTAVGALLVFSADDGTSGREVWRSDGTGLGTYEVEDIYPGAFDSDPEPLGVLGSELLFHAEDDTDGRELWKTDGTVAQQVKDIRPGISDSIVSPQTYSSAFVVFGSHLYFQANDGTHGEELWRSDGTELGTTLVVDTNPAVGVSGSPDSLVVAGGLLWYSADDGVNGRELWATNAMGTVAQMVVDLDGTELSSMSDRLTGFPGAGGTLLFGAAVNDLRHELWRAAGPTGPFTRLTDVTAPDDSRPADLTPFLDGVALIPVTGPEADQLVTWSQAQGAQTQSFFTGEIVTGLTVFQDTLFATDAGFEPNFFDYSGLWTFDGANETLVAEQNTGGLFVSGAADSGVVVANGFSLLFTDGTPVATPGDLEIASAPDAASWRIDGDFVWIADLDYDLWRTDLVAGTSEQIGDPTPQDEILLSKGVAAGRFFFEVVDLGVSSELWASDGTAQGTVPLGLNSASQTYEVATLDGRAVLALRQPDAWQFYDSDGTVAGTSLLGTVSGGAGLPGQNLLAEGGWAYLGTASGIWTSDGTAAGSYLVPDTLGFDVHEALDGFAVVSGLQEGRGLEFALLDPTTGALIPIDEVEPGPAGTEIHETTMNGEVLWASAFRSDVGRELFRLDLSPWLSLVFADGFENGDTASWSTVVPCPRGKSPERALQIPGRP